MQFRFGKKNKKTVVLMHKDLPVLSAEYDSDEISFIKVKEIYNWDHVPYSVRKDDTVSLKRLNHWFRWRGIPDYRIGLNRLLDRLGKDNQYELLNEYYALSVSDHYWLKEEQKKVSYEDISFFTHGFDQEGFGKAMFSLGRADIEDSALHTPNNTLAGYQKKAWFHRGNELYLLKGGSFLYQLEPVNEKTASEIGRRLGMDVVDYSTEIYENQIVSVCKNMLDDNHDLITADEVMSLKTPEKDKFHMYTYMDILEEHGIWNASRAMDDMLVLDFLMMNTDRHNQNLGVIINAETMEWEKAAPIFDTGTGLACLKYDEEVAGFSEIYNYRLFNSNKILDNIVGYLIQNIERYDFSALNGVTDYYREAMYKHRAISGISEERIESECSLLDKRIRLIEKMQMKAVRG